ncbi:MAG: AbrB family transcriptional regulator, partial [Sphaerochaetaceae bacterium]
MVILVLIVISIAGGLIFKKLKVPAGAMIGAMLAIAVVNSLLREPASCPIEIRIAMQICSGLIIGSRLTKRDLIELRVMLFPVLILIVMLLSITFL